MPDDRTLPFEPAPRDWGAAFAALPQEAPDAAAWRRVARAWPRRSRPRWPMWLAAAAALAAAAVVPWRLSMDAPSQPDAAPAAGRTADAAPAQSSPAPAGASPAARDADAAGEVSMPPTARQVASTDADGRDTPPSLAPRADASRPAPADAQPRVASAASAEGSPGTRAATDAPASELERLYAESARLEALVAMARDGRVATTGTAAALASQYDARVAGIDARLVDLGAAGAAAAGDERLRLWRQRVDAMRQLAGFESTQRLLAARGERYDAMLVSID